MSASSFAHGDGLDVVDVLLKVHRDEPEVTGLKISTAQNAIFSAKSKVPNRYLRARLENRPRKLSGST